MDSKTFRLSVAAIFTTVVLIAVVVYAANRDRINSLMGQKAESVSEEGVITADEEVSATQYGEQIGDNLKGFLTADDFFDKSEQRPSVVVVVDNVPVPANASSEDGTTDITDISDEAISASGEDNSKQELPDEGGSGEESMPDKEDKKAVPDKPDEEATDKADGEEAIDKAGGEATSDKADGEEAIDKADGEATSDKAGGEGATDKPDEVSSLDKTGEASDRPADENSTAETSADKNN